MSWFVNILLEAIPLIIMLSVLLVVCMLIPALKEYKPYVWRTYIGAVVVVLFIAATGSDTTYQHTTGYDKQADIRAMRVYDNVPTKEVEIVDKSRKPEFTVQENRKKLEEALDYKKDSDN